MSSKNLHYLDPFLLFNSNDDSGSRYFQIYPTSPSNDYFIRNDPDYIRSLLRSAFNNIENQIQILQKYEHNWDENGAEKFSKLVFEKISKIVKKLYYQIFTNFIQITDWLPKPYLLPNSDGSIDIVWRNDSIYLIINVSKDKKLYVAGKSKNEDNISLDSKKNIQGVLIEWLSLIKHLG